MADSTGSICSDKSARRGSRTASRSNGSSADVVLEIMGSGKWNGSDVFGVDINQPMGTEKIKGGFKEKPPRSSQNGKSSSASNVEGMLSGGAGALGVLATSRGSVDC